MYDLISKKGAHNLLGCGFRKKNVSFFLNEILILYFSFNR